uniref:K Homology domain-containing protein n=1 Tax=Kalanchoe fedtschenkoi TaxID=63787 RepID=A0A7N0U7N6_KALFE
MADQEVAVGAVTAGPVSSENKRKLDEWEPHRSQPEDVNRSSSFEPVKDAGAVDSDENDAKRPRRDEKTATDENGHQTENVGGVEVEKNEETSAADLKNAGDNKLGEANPVNEEQPSETGRPTEQVKATQEPTPDVANKESTDVEQPPSKKEPELDGMAVSSEDQVQPPSADTVQEAAQEKANSDTHTMSRKMDVPNNKVGVLIGKAGDTIRYLQINSGAKIQITRDAEADPRAPTRPVELIGSLESIEKAEKLIKDVISEADAGGAPSLVARGIASAQTVAQAEQIQMHVPNDKVGMIIGKGGETIKYLQTTSGARIQLIPQHLPEGDQSTERVVRVTGDKKQIEIAREMIMEVMTQPMRHSPRFGGYNQQTDRFRGASGAWGPHGGHYGQPSGYDYYQRAYPPQNPLHRPPAYGHYPGPRYGPRGGYGGPGWQQQPPMQRPSYDNYGRSGHFMDGSAGARGHSMSPNMGPIPSQASHDYGHQPQYPNAVPPPSGYGHGYDEMKYGTQAPVQHPYGGQGNTQPAYYQGHTGYAPDQQYGKPAPYAMPIPSQPAAPQAYGPPRPIQQEASYPAVNSASVQPYVQNVPPQQPAPYVAGAPAQPSYPTYPATDAYAQPQQAAAPGYVQQAVPGYAQPVAQQAPGVYASQGMQPGSYASYPTAQPAYPDQSAAASAVYNYQATAAAADPNAVYSTPQVSQGYAQPQLQSAQVYAQPQQQSSQVYVQPQQQSSQVYVQPQAQSSQGYGQPQPQSAQGYAQPQPQSTQQGYAQPQPVPAATYDQPATQ